MGRMGRMVFLEWSFSKDMINLNDLVSHKSSVLGVLSVRMKEKIDSRSCRYINRGNIFTA